MGVWREASTFCGSLHDDFEYFWLILLGLTCAIFIGAQDRLKSIISLLLGLLITTVGMNNVSGYPRFTFGNPDLLGGLSLIPVMIGMFALPEVLRYALTSASQPRSVTPSTKIAWGALMATIFKYPRSLLRGSTLGMAVGALPGAGSDIAAYISYGLSKKFSRTPEKFGTGYPEGIVEASAANNASLGGAWIPALVFGIPGDSVTAIVIGVLYVKGLNPGPTIFLEHAPELYAIFLIFILANLLLIPLGYFAIRVIGLVIRVPTHILMPTILIFCTVGAFAINNSLLDVFVMLAAGLLAYLMEENEFPLSPTILGIILGGMLEKNFIASLIKADGNCQAQSNTEPLRA